MATIKIISNTGGSFPAQQATLVVDQLTVRTSDGGQKIYAMRVSILSLNIVSEHKDRVTFDMKLRDGSQFRGEANKKLVYHLTRYVGNVPVNDAPVKEKTSEQVFQQNAIAGIVVLVIFVLLLSRCSGGSSSSSHSPTDDLETKKSEAAFYCKDAVKKSLKAPRTAEFPRGVDATPLGGNEFIVVSYVDAQNSFGALIRTQYACQVKNTGGGYAGWVLQDLRTF